jgi:hypothetical protein
LKDLLAFVEHLRADLGEAAAAIERQDIEALLEKFEGIAVRINTKAAELRGGRQ